MVAKKHCTEIWRFRFRLGSAAHSSTDQRCDDATVEAQAPGHDELQTDPKRRSDPYICCMEIPIWAWLCCTSPTRPPSSGWHPVTIQTDLERRSEAWICLHIDDEALHCSYCKHKPTGSQTLPNIKNSEKQGCKQSGARKLGMRHCSAVTASISPQAHKSCPTLRIRKSRGAKVHSFRSIMEE